MRRIIYSVAMSLDGYVAGPQGEVDWIAIDPQLDFRGMFSRFDTVLLGRKTYEAARRQGGGSMPGMKTVVVSRTLRPESHPAVTVIEDQVPATLVQMKSEPGKDIWLFGGGSLFSSLLAAGLVDAVEVAVIPILLGGGVPLLPPPAARAQLHLVDSTAYPATGTVRLEYAVTSSSQLR